MTAEENRMAAWRALQKVSGLTQAASREEWLALAEAAEAYAKAKWAAVAPPPKQQAGAVMPFGRDKGVPLSEAETKSLTWMRGAISESVADPAKSRWRGSNEKLLSAIDAELATR